MSQDLYIVGGKCSTGQEVEEILGQSAKTCVFITTDNQLRWVYWHNKGKLTQKKNEAIDNFNIEMANIKALAIAAEANGRASNNVNAELRIRRFVFILNNMMSLGLFL